MDNFKKSAQIVVLIDAENVSHQHITNVLNELASHGTVSVRRMYGDWGTEQLRIWKSVAINHSIQPVQLFANSKGKNASDIGLIIDAMDLLHQRHFDAFAIVSSDGDFTRLASRIRESGARALGFGERKTPPAFVNACDTFTYFDALQVGITDEESGPSSTSNGSPDEQSTEVTKPPERKSCKELRQDAKLMNLLRMGIAASSGDDGWAHFGQVGQNLKRQSPDFDARNWGYAKLRDLIETVDLFDIETYKAPNGHTNLRVRIRTKKSATK